MKLKLAVTVLVFCVAALLSLGLVMLYSSSMAESGSHFVKVQLVWSTLGLVACIAAGLLDYRFLKRLAWPLLVVSVVLLALVFAPVIGVRRNGANPWLGSPNASFFPPSDAANTALLL